MREAKSRREFMREGSIAQPRLTGLTALNAEAVASEGVAYLCITCGTQYPESAKPPEHCPICEDERQYVNPDGQKWTTLEDLRASHKNVDQEGGGPALLDQHRAEVRDRPAGVPDPDAEGATSCGTASGCWTTRRSRRSRSWAGSPRSRSRTRIITRRWSNGAGRSAARRSTCTRRSGPG